MSPTSLQQYVVLLDTTLESTFADMLAQPHGSLHLFVVPIANPKPSQND